ncbi:MAG TPA: HDOD domain-containing protein [Bacillota bacterium]|nr:HDOD domain-containing protein [Bacillota bacterium]
MEVYVGRQPIFNRDQEVIAYELLYRSSQQNAYDNFSDGDKATIDVIINSFLTIGIDKLANRKRCFINFTENLLEKEVPTYFSPNLLVVEILEDIIPTPNILANCETLKQLGYTIALDDFVFDECKRAFLPYTDIIKVDFMKTSWKERMAIIRNFQKDGLKFLAEKVETREEFQEALEMGFDYFQGYFFSKPVIIKEKGLSSFSQQYLILLEELNKIDPDINKIVYMVERDLSLSYRLLKLVNTAAYHFRNKVTSLKQAIVLLGLYEIKKWITVMLMSSHSFDFETKEVIRLCLTRAKMAEKIGKLQHNTSSEHFLLGLFSLMDTLLHRPMQEVLEDLPLSTSIKEGLLDSSTNMGTILLLIEALEQADMKEIADICEILCIQTHDVFYSYRNSLEWANEIVDSM